MHCSFTALFDEDNAGNNLEDEEEHQEEVDFQKKMSCIGVDCPSSSSVQQRREAEKQRKKSKRL